MDFIHVDRSSPDDWRFGVGKIVKRFEKSHAKVALSAASHSVSSPGGLGHGGGGGNGGGNGGAVTVTAPRKSFKGKFNYAEALRWYEASARQGHRMAQESVPRARKKLDEAGRFSLQRVAKKGATAMTGMTARHTDPSIVWGTLDAVL